MRRRTGWGSSALRFARLLCGVLPIVAAGTAAHGQVYADDIQLGYRNEAGYDEGSDQFTLVSYRPRCGHCAPNCCTCQSGCAPYESGAMVDSPSDAQQPDIMPEGTPLTPGQYAAGDTGTFVAAAMQSNVGYVDGAIIWSQIRTRFDAGFGANVPDRAEFFYAKYGIFGQGANGPIVPDTDVDFQDISLYMENAFSDRFSLFAELPIRFLDPDVNANTAGLGDMNAGFKFAMIAERDTYFTFQFRTYIPTGDSDRGLGTNHASVEPGLLLFRRSGRLRWESELKHWISTGGSDFAGNVLRYGTGLGYDLFSDRCSNTRLTPIAEFVGWTVLDGGKIDFTRQDLIGDADGDTIVNLKLGTRYVSGDNSIYGGWGHALTGDVWYKDFLRLEYRRVF